MYKMIKWNTNGERPNTNWSPSMFHQEILAINTAAQAALTAVNKVETIIFDVESNHVIPLQHNTYRNTDTWIAVQKVLI